MHSDEHKDRVALVTGGSRGIGSAICRELARSGALVYVNYHHHREAAETLVNGITVDGGRGRLLAGSISEPAAVDRMFALIEGEHARLDILVNNAGILRDDLISAMTPAVWQDVMNTNLTGAFLCSARATRLMIAQRFGRIVNVSSVAGFRPRPGQANYAASKAGLISLTKSLALELARYGVRVNGVAPGCIDTDMLAQVDDEARRRLAATCPMERIGTAEEVARAVMFLLSDSASYIQGQTIVVDGGASIGQF